MENMVLGLGCTPSIIDGSEYEFEEIKSLSIPEEYSFKTVMPPILNQGSTNMCVTYSVGAHLDWNINMDFGTDGKDNHVDRKEIYSARTIAGDNGMTFKEALSFVRHHGVKTDSGIVTLDHYAKIGNATALKQAILINGPCVGGMMCYNSGPEFWKELRGDKAMGGHAISIIGYNKEGFIIRNSWGTVWADRGYGLLRYEDFHLLFEAWTIID